jgi:hypothetical protein
VAVGVDRGLASGAMAGRSAGTLLPTILMSSASLDAGIMEPQICRRLDSYCMRWRCVEAVFLVAVSPGQPPQQGMIFFVVSSLGFALLLRIATEEGHCVLVPS